MTYVTAALFAICFVAALVLAISAICLMFMRNGRKSFWAMTVGFQFLNPANLRPEAARVRKVTIWSIVTLVTCFLMLIFLAAIGASGMAPSNPTTLTPRERFR